ncbi:MAG TPA: sugar transferase [Alloacidobacterium sp.]|nr:sugar transferase [Alloacidobacterium sp.]
MTLLDSIDEATMRSLLSDKKRDHSSISEEAFRKMLAVERKRTERSGSPFLLLLLDVGRQHNLSRNERILEKIMTTLVSNIRETDVIGWYQDQVVIGILFTGLIGDDRNEILNTILVRVSRSLKNALSLDQFNQLSISFHFFPDEWDHEKPGRPSDETLYPEDSSTINSSRRYVITKRVMDIVGSIIAILSCLPLFVIIALVIKLTSKGPILFRQQRVGQYGKCFSFLKFRSMYVDNNPAEHREYVARLIAGHAEANTSSQSGATVFKLIGDKRITRIGRIIRKTSLDEIPQFINVLRGDMSLVGPRPAIPYEVAAYKTWHRRRVLNVKPGITGLWQVNGRNRIKFDDMVRLDIQYAKLHSPWLDLKIMMRTPAAIVKGAY